MTALQSTGRKRQRRSPYSPGIDAHKLRELRFVRGLSQDQLGARAGLSRAWVAKLEGGRGKPSVDTLRAFCDALDCSPAALLDGPTLRHLAAALGVTVRELRKMDDLMITMEDLDP